MTSGGATQKLPCQPRCRQASCRRLAEKDMPFLLSSGCQTMSEAHAPATFACEAMICAPPVDAVRSEVAEMLGVVDGLGARAGWVTPVHPPVQEGPRTGTP